MFMLEQGEVKQQTVTVLPKEYANCKSQKNFDNVIFKKVLMKAQILLILLVGWRAINVGETIQEEFIGVLSVTGEGTVTVASLNGGPENLPSVPWNL
ncbi:hypothetical protein GIB67_005366 [Kingdonia uniflora]|uniref:Uncharacterized protein n=1 Tax=Kingdonia uniflora TaxID=39325 RepID=A0A7J7NHL2_9MAGN|nr:hypothetical protein GIB67_005366 [Kingdonia uniflora]